MTSRIFIEEIASEELLRSAATEDDRAYVAAFGSARRRCEVLAWRNLVRREVGRDCHIGYEACGAPIITNPNIHIGVSHCCDRVAVILAEKPCAIDIETTERNFAGVAERFLTPEELRLSGDELLLGRLWCAKEAAYKLCRTSSLNLREDIQITEYLPAVERFTAVIRGTQRICGYFRVEAHHIVAIIESDAFND